MRDGTSNASLCFQSAVEIIVAERKQDLQCITNIVLIYVYVFRLLFLTFLPNFQIYGGCFSEDRCWYRCMVQRMINSEKAGTIFFSSFYALVSFFIFYAPVGNKCNSSLPPSSNLPVWINTKITEYGCVTEIQATCNFECCWWEDWQDVPYLQSAVGMSWKKSKITSGSSCC